MTQSILITGCSSGIGYFCAKKLVKNGYKVVATCRNKQDVIRLNSEGITSVVLDLSNESSIEQGFTQALKILGHIDVLFNNGAYGQPGAVEDLPTQSLRTQFETNLFGWHHLTCLAVKHMRPRNYGRIIQNSSVLGLVAMPYRGAYNASKFALEGLTDTLRLELSDTHIQVSLIEPGPIATKFRENALKAFYDSGIDIDSSVHKDNYHKQLSRLEGQSQPFTLGPDAVYQRVIRAIEAKQAKPRYYVTFPTYLFGYLKRFLSSTLLDKLLVKSR
jgi:NAD(P)-dependent dehydrogenase (short-subunit alcohol dehydrogenase family)